MTPDEVVVQIVDDHRAHAVGLANILVDTGFHFLEPVLRSEDVSSDATVVVLDLHLAGGGLSGSAAVSFITSKLKPVVATSGAVGAHVIADAIGCGAVAFIDKKVTVPEVWKDVLLAAHQHQRTVTAHTAAALLTDADWRPILPTDDDFTAEARQFLEEMLEAADDSEIRKRRPASSTWVKNVTDHIWSVTAERTNLWNIPIRPVLEPAVPLLYGDHTQRSASHRTGIPLGTINDALNKLKEAVDERTTGTTSPLLGRAQMGILRFLVRNRDEDRGTSGGVALQKDAEPTKGSTRRKKAPRRETGGL